MVEPLTQRMSVLLGGHMVRRFMLQTVAWFCILVFLRVVGFLGGWRGEHDAMEILAGVMSAGIPGFAALHTPLAAVAGMTLSDWRERSMLISFAS